MSFKISALVDKTDSFAFVFDEFELTGRYYKYKTQTPSYAKGLLASVPEELTEGSDEEKALREELRDKALSAAVFKSISDTIIEWNATDDNDQPVPIAEATFESLPVPFIKAFRAFLEELIYPKKEATD